MTRQGKEDPLIKISLILFGGPPLNHPVFLHPQISHQLSAHIKPIGYDGSRDPQEGHGHHDRDEETMAVKILMGREQLVILGTVGVDVFSLVHRQQ